MLCNVSQMTGLLTLEKKTRVTTESDILRSSCSVCREERGRAPEDQVQEAFTELNQTALIENNSNKLKLRGSLLFSYYFHGSQKLGSITVPQAEQGDLTVQKSRDMDLRYSLQEALHLSSSQDKHLQHTKPGTASANTACTGSFIFRRPTGFDVIIKD